MGEEEETEIKSITLLVSVKASPTQALTCHYPGDAQPALAKDQSCLAYEA